jgi:hypothetical protein
LVFRTEGAQSRNKTARTAAILAVTLAGCGEVTRDITPQRHIDRQPVITVDAANGSASSGLIIASDYPIQVRYSHPFNQWECAGFDCLGQN